MDAIKHLPKKENKKKKININLIVIKVDLNGNLKNSKPCCKCIKFLDRIKNYKIKYVFYSGKHGSIECAKFKDLKNDPNKHISSRFRNRKNKNY